ncbi:hypothetical protein LGM58_36045, partial [Burkholderia contaminans]|uniref:hypothetical protein n=1 Tax=Burkholderia contaminans TaxID=488447 RepID=UPI001CF34E2F
YAARVRGALRALGLPGKTCLASCSWLHSLKSWSLHKTRGGSVRVTATATVQLTSHFDFRKWDNEDGNYMPMGHGTIESTHDFPFGALVTITGSDRAHMKIAGVEILRDWTWINLGEIEPDWMSNPEIFDPDEWGESTASRAPTTVRSGIGDKRPKY